MGDAHQENFTSYEQKCLEKLKLFKDAKVLVYDMDDARVVGCVNRSAFKGEYFAWSRQRRDVPLYIASVEKREAETVVSYIYKGKEAACSIPFIDEASLANSVSCLAVCLHLGMSPETIAARMAVLETGGHALGGERRPFGLYTH